MNNARLRWLAAACLAGSATLPAPAFASQLTVDVVDAASGMPLEEAVVELYAPTEPVAATQQAQMAQRDQTFEPHVLTVPVGSAVNFPNLDDTRHHVYSFSPAKTFELKLYLNEPMAPVVFDKPGVVVLGCNIHDHMQAFVVVSEASRMAVTDTDGRARFDDVPEQPMRLTAWHPRLSNDHARHYEQQVTPRGQSLSLSLELNLPIKPERSRSSLQQLFDQATQ